MENDTQITMKRKNPTYNIVVVGFMAALVFASSKISIQIPSLAGDPTRFHFGNVFCLLAGLLFGGLKGGLAGGIGSAFYDLFDPIYITSAPFTFFNKFMMSFVCGKIAYSGKRKGNSMMFNIIAVILGQITYIVLYLAKSYFKLQFFLHAEKETILIELLQKLGTSSFNATIAVIISLPLAFALKKALANIPLYKKVMSK